MLYVYVATVGEFVKIGRSRQPLARLRSISTDTGIKRPLGARGKAKLVHSAEAEESLEVSMHASLKQYRVIGEWYGPECLNSPEIEAFMQKPFKSGGRPSRRRGIINISTKTHAWLRETAKTDRRKIQDVTEILLTEAKMARKESSNGRPQ